MRRTQQNILFANGDLGPVLRANLQDRPGRAIDSISKDQLLATPEDDLIEHLFAEMAADPLCLHEDRMESTDSETKVDVAGDPNRLLRDHSGPFLIAGHEIRISIPFTGEEGFWRLKPDSWKSVFPHGDIRSSYGDSPGTLELVFAVPVDNLNEEALGNEIERELELVRFYVEASAKQVEGYNHQLREQLASHIQARKQRLSKTEGISARLGLPLKRNPNAPSVEPIALKRKLVRPLPPPPDSGFQPEPGIDEDVYEHILGVIRHEVRTTETTPSTYEPLGEEALRDILLAHLNGHYEGDATGETFRNKGKTDIRIEDDDRAAFVAECKLWSGPKALSEAVDQLLGYLSWRDCKAALIVWNKSVKGFASLLESAPDQMRAHSLYKSEIEEQRRDGEWRFKFRSPEDELREITVHLFLVNLYC